MQTAIFQKTNSRFLFSFFLISALVIFVYSASLSVPFYLDDFDSIITNPYIKMDSPASLFETWYRTRIVGYLTIWGNYQIGELNPAGYHVVNIVIHLINTCLVYFLVRILFVQFGQDQSTKDGKTLPDWFFPLLVAAIWALHPLNSQTVIYVIQRLASLVATFMFLSTIFYLKARTASGHYERIFYVIGALICGVLGFFTKQNFVSIIVFLLILELLLCSQIVREKIFKAFIVLFVIGVFSFPFLAELRHFVDSYTRDPGAVDRVPYFYTQIIVLWDYIYRFFLPIELQMEINTSLKTSLEPLVALAMVGHLALAFCAFRIRRRIPLFSVGIFLFYSSHLVESSIIPIKDLAFEHRTYVGNVGLILATLSLLTFFLSLDNDKVKRTFSAFSLLLIVVYSGLTFSRVLQWQDPLSFYAREVTLAPEHPRALASYGNELLKLGQFEKAEQYLQKSILLNLNENKVSASALNAYMTTLYQQGKFQQAAPVVMRALKYEHHSIRRSDLLSNLAVGYIYMGFCDFATSLLSEAISLNPYNENAKNNMAHCHGLKNNEN